MAEIIVETKTCKHCWTTFTITDKDIEFYDKISPIFNGVKYQIPSPTLCPDCRQQRRLSFRNERKLYKRTCDATGKQIISIYSEDKPYKVYDQKVWRSDQRDPMEYGQEYDFIKLFMEQFKELLLVVPKLSIVNMQSENSEYTNRCNYNKDCYLVFMTSYSENSLYGTFVQKSQYCVDCLQATNSNHCYECCDVEGCSQLKYSNHCSSCSFSVYLDYCYGCSNCYGCHNLKNQQYYIFNKQYTKEEYSKILPTITLEQIQQERKNIIQESAMIRCEDCIWSNITDSKNCRECYNGFDGEDSKYLLNFWDIKDGYDCTAFGHKCAMNIENIAGEEDYATGYTFSTVRTQNIWYSMNCYDSSYLFGCDGLRNKKYCILNKQYTKQEYEILVPKIIEQMQTNGEWGEFFPANISPFGYNETIAQEYFPLSKEETLQQWYAWSDYEIPFPYVDKMLKPSELPNIQDATDTILQQAILCEVTWKPFRIIKPELDFYRKHNLPLPHKHPDQRHLERMQLRNPRKLFDRKCDKCWTNIQTTYSPERPEIVYCEACYAKEIYW